MSGQPSLCAASWSYVLLAGIMYDQLRRPAGGAAGSNALTKRHNNICNIIVCQRALVSVAARFFEQPERVRARKRGGSCISVQ